MMWNTGFGMGAGMWLVMAVGTVVFWVVVAMAVRALLGSRPHSRQRLTSVSGHQDAEQPGAGQVSAVDGPQGPLGVLQDRLARGEIDVDEYARIRQVLVKSQPSLAADATPAETGGDAPHV